jgi:hypothetical protein
VSALAASVASIDLLARMELGARRAGKELRLHDASRELRELVELCGLADVLRLEPRGQSEEREQRLGVEEERQLGDPPAREPDDL